MAVTDAGMRARLKELARAAQTYDDLASAGVDNPNSIMVQRAEAHYIQCLSEAIELGKKIIEEDRANAHE